MRKYSFLPIVLAQKKKLREACPYKSPLWWNWCQRGLSQVSFMLRHPQKQKEGRSHPMERGTYISCNRKDGHSIENVLPDTYGVSFRSDRSPILSRQLPGIHADLYNVVHESKQGGQGKRGHEQCDKPELNNWRDTGQPSLPRRWRAIQPSSCHLDPHLFSPASWWSEQATLIHSSLFLRNLQLLWGRSNVGFKVSELYLENWFIYLISVSSTPKINTVSQWIHCTVISWLEEGVRVFSVN